MTRFIAPVLFLFSSFVWADALEGWEVLSGDWGGDDGVVVGRAEEGVAWLKSDGVYWDFDLELEFLAVGGAQGGVQVRSHWLPDEGDLDTNVFYGYQCTIDPRSKGGTGAVIDKNGRGKLVGVSPEAAKAVVSEGWNRLRVEARGSVMTTWVNGVQANVVSDEAFIGGHVALQVMPGAEGSGEIRFRDINIEDLGRVGDWRSLFDGESLAGWKNFGEETFEVRDGVIACSSGPKKSEGYLLTDESWTDFRVRGRFNMLGKGNYGLFYHASVTLRERDGYPIISGIQGEVDPRSPGPTGWHYEPYLRNTWLYEKPQRSSMRAYAARPNEWGEIEIRVVKNRATSWVNGIRIVDFDDENPQVLEGGFALQLHDGGAEGILWKDLYVLKD